ncbi:MAG: GreA/GreB family elongation factor, partial [Verrucomicrobia bacterium]|nr:GreA/GreB family elongation factor [Verrucomicrobiota bacterium]
EVAIPENSKEIGVAISYGDLRENFEYQAAKDMQGLLMRRKAELERDLVEVRGTDFAEARNDAVARGTCVDILLEDGRARTFGILGEWDRDETLNIISSESELAKRLIGKRVGETARIPIDEQEQDCTISAIRLLSAEIKAWASHE